MNIYTENILVIGACGQLGTELTLSLREIYGAKQVIASDLQCKIPILAESGPFEQLDVMDSSRLGQLVDKYKINQIYHLAAILSATGEKILNLPGI